MTGYLIEEKNSDHQKLLEKAKDFSYRKHMGQTRDDGKTPYYKHPFNVAEILKRYGFDFYHQIIGLLHDILEDTNTTREELEETFTSGIAGVVWMLTCVRNPGETHHERCVRMNEKIKYSASDVAKIVKLADRLDNLSSMSKAWPDWKVMRYIKETKTLLEAIGKVEPDELKKEVEKVLEKERNALMEKVSKEK